MAYAYTFGGIVTSERPGDEANDVVMFSHFLVPPAQRL